LIQFLAFSKLSSAQNETILDAQAIQPNENDISVDLGPSAECDTGVLVAYRCFEDAIDVAKATACK
jgi:hypothetical protein